MVQEFSKNSDAFLCDGDNNVEYRPSNLTFPETLDLPIGKRGRLRKRYLKERQPALYAQMLKSNRLMQHLADTERAACNRIALLIPAMAKQEGVTETLKAENQLEWVRRMNSIKNRVDEIILHELIYE